MDVLRELILPKLDGVRPSSGGYTAKCPAHDDGRASLSVGPGKEHPVLINCFAGCDRDDILAKIGLNWSDLCAPRDEQALSGDAEWTPRGPAIAVYDYLDEHGSLLFQVCRTADKQFPQRRPDQSKPKGWSWKLGEVRRVLYRLPRLVEVADSGERVFIAEGEKDVHTLERVGEVATCCPGGAGKWRPEYDAYFLELDVTIVADRDEPGRKHARMIAESLTDVAKSVRIVESVEGKDVTDHLNSGHKIDELEQTWPTATPAEALAPDLWEFLSVDDTVREWVIPGLLERGDRLVWTGFEGLGKSMFIRQLAVCVAAGLDPFLLAEIDPMRVLLIDCENSERQGRRKFRPLAAASIKVGRRVPNGALRLIHRSQGLDLGRPDDRAWLLERVTAHRPDLLMIGPFYKLHVGNINEEIAARATVAALDAARTAVDCALVVEAHAGHGEQGKNRSVRPLGSSLLLRWPEFGYGIAPAGEPDKDGRIRHVHVKPWRGDRDERSWPTELVWGDPWPWAVPTSHGSATYDELEARYG